MAARASCSSCSDSCASCSRSGRCAAGSGVELDLLRQDARQIAPRALGEVEPLERVERRLVGVVEREHVPPGRDRLLRLAERLLVQLGGAIGELLLLVEIVRQPGPLLEDLHQLLVAALVGQQALERLVGVDGVVAHADDLAPALDGRGAIAELLLLDLGDARMHPRLQIVVVRVGDRLLQHLDEPLPHAEHVRQAPQLVEQLGLALGGVGLARLFRPGARQRGEGQPHVAAALLVQAGDLAQELDALAA